MDKQEESSIDLYDNLDNPFIHPNTDLQDEENAMPTLINEAFTFTYKNPINLDKFKEEFAEKTCNQFKDFDWTNIVAAGGIVSSILLDLPCSSSDIDIFLIKDNMNDDEVKIKINQIYDTIAKNLNVTPLLFKTPNTITLSGGYPNKYIQIVLRVCSTIHELLSFFDLDCCAVAYNGVSIVTLPRYIRCIKTMTNFVDVRKLNNEQFCQRIYKYRSKGFRFCFGLYGVYLSSHELDIVNKLYKKHVQNVFTTNIKNNDSTGNLYEYIKLPFSDIYDVNAIKEYLICQESNRKSMHIKLNKIPNGDFYEPTYNVITMESLNEMKNIVDWKWRKNIYFVKDFVRKCYACKRCFTLDTSDKIDGDTNRESYPRLCDECYGINDLYNDQVNSLDFTGQVVLITGGRINIGKELVTYFLEKNATVITTSRFPKSTLEGYKSHPHYDIWKNHLNIFGVDFRHRLTLINTLDHINEAFDRIDILINCAAQTIKQPALYYSNEIHTEKTLSLDYNKDDKSIILPDLKDKVSYQLVETIDSTYMNNDSNSWTSKLTDISDLEMVEAHMINVIAPFMIITKLKHKMINMNGYAHIINVSSPEGLFNAYKNSNHPHTNMAKASLNMMTRTSAADFIKHNIIMNCVDTGWVSNMMPGKQRNEFGMNSECPLQVHDSIQRILYPILLQKKQNIADYGKFYQEFKIVDW